MQIPVAFLVALEEEWGVRPILVLACAGYSDQHLQIWHGDAMLDPQVEEPMPAYVVVDTVDGPAISVHPDADPDHIEYVWDGAALVLRTE